MKIGKFRGSLALAASLMVLVAALFLTGRPGKPPRAGESAALAPSGGIDKPQFAASGMGQARLLPSGRRARHAPLAADVLDHWVDGNAFHMRLPDGREAVGDVELVERDGRGVLTVQGRLSLPEAGRYFFHRQTVKGVAGDLVGDVMFDRSEIGWKVTPSGVGGSPVLTEVSLDEIVCRGYPKSEIAEGQGSPQTFPDDLPQPVYQEVVPLQSLPGATGVLYLDFDGEKGPFIGWGSGYDAEPSGISNEDIRTIWQRVAEDYLPFNLNVTTDRRVYDAAPRGSRQQVIITPTRNAAPGNWGGYARGNSFNLTANVPCFVFETGVWGAETISHEAGHTFNLGHDGRTSPSEEYYYGHGSSSVSWAPIMGAGFYRSLSQWSKGEYLNANNTSDDVQQIANGNNVGFRPDDAGSTLAGARHMDILHGGTIVGEGIIERQNDKDAFRFRTTGGLLQLSVSPAEEKANLDVLAELIDADTGVIVYSSNPDLDIDAAIDITLEEGEYYLLVSGTGRGDPLGDGYTNYGSLGAYHLSGTIVGGVEATRFSVAENSPADTAVGTVSPMRDHGGSPLTWSITSGNAGSIFSIEPATGMVRVASQAGLNYEAFSSKWDDPADVELFVSISDPANSALNESLRVVVSVTDMNEAPVIGNATGTMLERSMAGTTVLRLSGQDPDQLQYPLYSIVSGNDQGWFSVDPVTGDIRVAANIEVATNQDVALVVRGIDQGTPALETTASVTLTIVNIQPGYMPGGIMAQFYKNITGSSVASLTTNTKYPGLPDEEQFFANFDNFGYNEDNYGCRVRGYFIPPVSGNYQFTLASDDASELRFSLTSSPADATLIASVTGWTDPYTWPNTQPQQSASLSLTAGQPYYIEALHKEGTGGDHMSVAMSGPGIPKQLLRGIYLAPYGDNYAPVLTNTTFYVRSGALAGQMVGKLPVTDVNVGETYVYSITSGNSAGIFSIDSATGVVRVAAPQLLNPATVPTHTLSIRITDQGVPVMSARGTMTVAVRAADTYPSGNLVQEVWSGIYSGGGVSDLQYNKRFPNRPSYCRYITGFASGNGIENYYGSRIQAILRPDVTGDYTFSIAGDDACSLFLNPNGDTPVTTSYGSIARTTSATGRTEWAKFTSQKSAMIRLEAGKDYYLAATHKENTGDDHVNVGWTLPGATEVTAIPGSMLRPYDSNQAPVFQVPAVEWSVAENSPTGTAVGNSVAEDPNGESVVYAVTSSSSPGAFAVNPLTGAVTVANPSLIVPGAMALTVKAQDGGIGGILPYKTAERVYQITVVPGPRPPVFNMASWAMNATAGSAFASILSATDENAGDVLTYNKVSGPAWLTVSADGTIGGTPLAGDAGSNEFTVRVTDSLGAFAQSVLVIRVLTPSEAWRLERFGNADAVGDGADGADPDHDGLFNLIEYGCATDPNASSARPYALSKIGGTMEFVFARNKAASDVVYTVEWSDTLQGAWSNSGVELTVLSDNGTTQQIKATLPAGSYGSRFVRLKVNR